MLSSRTNCLKEWWFLFKTPIQDPGTFVDFAVSGTAVPGADDPGFQTVVVVAEDGSEFSLAPGYTVVNADLGVYARQPGLQWIDIECTVGQMGDGDFQAASVLSGNLVLTPTRPLPVNTVVVDTAEKDALP